MPELNPIDVGKGWKVSFQRSIQTQKVRAVVKDPNGEIRASGPVVDEADYLKSQQAAMLQVAGLILAPPPRSCDDLDEEELDDDFDLDDEED